MNTHNQVLGHRTGSSHSGVEKYPTEETQTKPKVVLSYQLLKEVLLFLPSATSGTQAAPTGTFLTPPRHSSHFYRTYIIGFGLPPFQLFHGRRLSSNFANSRSRAFRSSSFYARKSPYGYECSLGDTRAHDLAVTE